MKKSTLFILTLAFLGLILGSCSTSSDLSNSSVLKKRRYLKGYQVNIRGSHKATKRDEVTARTEPVAPRPARTLTANTPADPVFTAQASATPVLTDADLDAPSTETSFSGAKPETTPESAAKAPIAQYAPDREKHFKSAPSYASPAVRGTASASASDGGSLVLYIILAILLPPLAVGLLYGIGPEFLISLLLWLLLYIPGLIYALIKVFQKF